MVKLGQLSVEQSSDTINMHCHTFFSFNAYGYSPIALIWLAIKMGWKLIGMVDFDILDGIDEFMNAGNQANVRATAGIETRVYIPQFQTREINSPGEPGVAYHMGIGFTSSIAPPLAAKALEDLRGRANKRNLLIVEKVNSYIQSPKIDYYNDVLTLSPSGAPTERHIVSAYILAAEKYTDDLVGYWSKKLLISENEVEISLGDRAKLHNLIRTKLLKKGGPGYIDPTPETFPSIDEFHKLILGCGALPTFAWLDGTSKGEQDIEELLLLLIDKGVVAVNIIPDRNWNINDPYVRQKKVKNLNNFIALAKSLDLPINVGTEMNSFGNKLADDFSSIELIPHHQTFLDGAFFVYGHTALQSAYEMGYQSDWSKSYLTTRQERNNFFMNVGKIILPEILKYKISEQINNTMTPQDVLKILAKKGYK